MKFLLIVSSCLVLNGCAFYPKQVEYYDSECNIKYRKLKLKQSSSGMGVGKCNNETCISALASIPIQALVAGSIVIAGNTVYWLEREGRCLLKTTD
jgi:hypothetical protein